MNIYSPEELARLWKVSTMTVYKLIGQNKVPHFRVGRSYRIPADYLGNFMMREGNLRQFLESHPRELPASVRHFIALLKKETKKIRENVVELCVYGSYARGTATDKSDIDLLMIVERLDRKVDHWVASLSDRAMNAANYEELLSVMRISKVHWLKHQALQSPFFLGIQKENISLWPH